MKTVRCQLWCGNRARPCIVTYSVNSIGSKSLYEVDSITDARTKEEYDVASVLSLNGDMDVIIAASDPKQVAFAKKELGVTLGAPSKKRPVKKPQQKLSTNDLLDGL